ncbi:GNAT family N-acetyltransferase [Streptomyces capparidis]
MRIRSARPDDGAPLALLDHREWSTLHSVRDRPAPDAPFFAAPPGDYLVAEADGRLIGYLRLGHPTPRPNNAHIVQIQGLVVDSAVRGRGVGRALLAAAYDEARRRGARRVTLRVLGHNARARRLYEQAGYAVEGVAPEEFLLDGVYVDDVLMGRWVR